MKHIKYINEFNSMDELSEAAMADKVKKILGSAGKHATIAIIQYLNENPDIIKDVFTSVDKDK